jgi:hypothetical protein
LLLIVNIFQICTGETQWSFQVNQRHISIKIGNVKGERSVKVLL